MVWLGTELGAHYFQRPTTRLNFGISPRPALDPFFRWDAEYYAALARYGYGATAPGLPPPSLRVAFPLYPLLARAAGGSDLALLLLPNLCFLVALALLFVVARRHLDADRARLAVWLLALGPSAMFFSYPYSESLFLLLTLGAFLLMESDHWLMAGVAGAAAGATRVPGVLLSIALGAEFGAGNRRRAVVAAAVLPLIGLAAVSALDWFTMGDPLGFVKAQAVWVGPPRGLQHLLGSFPKAVLDGDPFRPEAIGIPIFVAFALAAVWVAVRMPTPYGALAVTSVLLAGREGWYLNYFISVPRYVAVVFPCYFAFASLLASRRSLQLSWLSVSGSLLVVYSALYGSWRLIG
jgi:hypothetical protein